MKSRVVTGVLIEKDGSYLFGRKRKNVGPYPNTWVMIGGGLDLDKESIEEGIRRETLEEAGLEIRNLKRLSFDEDTEPDKNGTETHYLFLVYTASYLSGIERPGDDVVELKWIKKTDFNKYPMSRPTVKLFREIGWI